MGAEEFAQLYLRHRSRLYGLCLRRVRDPALAEDIVQDVFERAFAARSRFDRARAFWPWIASIAARECLDAYRHRLYVHDRLVELAATEARDDSADTTTSTVLRHNEHDALGRQLAELPPRQRMALQLFAVEGWSYAQIGEQLGYSVGAVKALIVRARSALRRTRDRALGGFVGGLRALRSRWERLGRGPFPFAGCGEAVRAWLATVGGQPTVAALMLVSAYSAMAPAAAHERPAAPAPSAVAAVDREARGTVTEAVPPTPAPAAGAPRRPAATPSPTGKIEQAVHELAAPLLYRPSPDEDPERVEAESVTVSPHYEEDHTVFVVGRPSPGHRVPVLVSKDGGASWRSLAARGLASVRRVLLPPAYPVDDRVFALGDLGLHVSRDGGESFETVLRLPGTTDASFAPASGPDDPELLVVAGGVLFASRSGHDALEPVTLEGVPDRHFPLLVESVRHSPDYEADRTVLVGTLQRTPGLNITRVNRCRWARRPHLVTPTGAVQEGPLQLDCASARLPYSLWDRLHTTSSHRLERGLLFASDGVALWVSSDDGATFRGTSVGAAPHFFGFLHDLDAVPSATGRSLVVAGLHYAPETPSGNRPALARTDDAGATWRKLPVDVPGFVSATAVAVTPTGRIIAAGTGGIVCSPDGGATWARLCPTPDT